MTMVARPHNFTENHSNTIIVETHKIARVYFTVNCDCTDEISTQKPHEKMSLKSPFAHKTPYYFHSYYDVLFFFTGEKRIVTNK